MSADRCPVCGAERRIKLWLTLWAIIFALGMFAAHLFGIRFCYTVARSVCGVAP